MKELSYTYCYCEENIYRLVNRAREDDSIPFQDWYVIFMSEDRTCVGKEKVGEWESEVPYRPCETETIKDLKIWDYHVIAIAKEKTTEKWFAFDFDSKLRSPTAPMDWERYCCSLEDYVTNTLFFDSIPEFSYASITDLLNDAWFRIMKAEDYMIFLRSDRSHMITEGNYSATPPKEPPILVFPEWATPAQRNQYSEATRELPLALQQNNLACFINMNNTQFPGVMVQRDSFLQYFQKL